MSRFFKHVVMTALLTLSALVGCQAVADTSAEVWTLRTPTAATATDGSASLRPEQRSIPPRTRALKIKQGHKLKLGSLTAIFDWHTLSHRVMQQFGAAPSKLKVDEIHPANTVDVYAINLAAIHIAAIGLQDDPSSSAATAPLYSMKWRTSVASSTSDAERNRFSWDMGIHAQDYRGNERYGSCNKTLLMNGHCPDASARTVIIKPDEIGVMLADGWLPQVTVGFAVNF